MEKYIRQLGRNSIIFSIILLFFGFLMFMNPIETIGTLMIIFGAILVLDGLVHFIFYFSIKDDYRFFSGELMQAIIFIILGFVLMLNYQNITYLLPIVLGIWIIVDSISKVQIALNIRDITNSHWGFLMTMGIITGLLGVVVVFNPVESFEMVIKLCACILMITETISIFESFSIISRVGEFEKIEKVLKGESKKTKGGKK